MDQLSTLCLSNLTCFEDKALRAYKAASNDNAGKSKCFDLNRDLRNGIRVDELPTAQREMAECLDNIFRRCPRLEKPITVYRGLGTRMHLPLNESGRCFRSMEFWSTACTKEVAVRFITPVCTPAYGALLQLELPRGCPAYNIESLHSFGGNEAELLLPRGMLWKVEKCSLIEKTDTLIIQRDKFENVAYAVLKAKQWCEPAV